MTQIETVQFSCPTCAKRLRARADQAGRTYACPGCGGAVPVPRIGLPPEDERPAESPPEAEAEANGGGRRLPSSVGELAIVLFIFWSVVAFVALVISFFGTVAAYVGLGMFLLASLVGLQQAWQLLRAPQKVMTVKEVPLFWGTVRLVAWEPTEGVLILRNKAVTFHDDDLHDGRGGVRFTYPFLGEEVALRVPLETQTLHFEDREVLTREYLRLSVRGTLKWRIVDVKKFYLLVSRELRSAGDALATSPQAAPRETTSANAASATTRRLVDAAVAWLRGIAEEQTRQVVSRVRSGLLIADKVMADVAEVRRAEEAARDEEFGSATEGLAGAIHDAVAERLKEYGIAVAECSLQEVRLPAEVVEQCVQAARTAYLPLMAKREATTRREALRAEVDVLGREAVGAREVVSAAPAYALRDFLTEFVSQHATPPTPATPGTPSAPVATIDVSKLAAIEGTTSTPGDGSPRTYTPTP